MKRREIKREQRESRKGEREEGEGEEEDRETVSILHHVSPIIENAVQ